MTLFEYRRQEAEASHLSKGSYSKRYGRLSDILTDISNTAGEEITDDEYKRLIEDRRRSAASSCEKTSNGLTAQIELEKRMLCFQRFVQRRLERLCGRRKNGCVQCE